MLCGEVLQDDETSCCKKCLELYPVTPQFDEDFFAPLFPYCQAVVPMAHYRYLSKAISAFKFHDKMAVGIKLSELFAKRLLQEPWIEEIDLIVPVPLHSRSLRKRHFNQCEIVASLIQDVAQAEVSRNNLVKIRKNKSQHFLTEEQRYENLKNVYSVKNPELLENKTILLIDDVITTCSTLKACCEVLCKIEGITIYAAALSTTRIRV